MQALSDTFHFDVHLGSKSAKAEFLIEFLRRHDADKIYLVGDIVDGWRLRRSWHWPQSHNDVVQKILRKGRKGAKIIYVAGNHDEFLRPFQGVHFGGIVVTDRHIHETADGRRFLIIHGDQFDVIVHHAKFLAYFGDWAYEMAIAVNSVNDRIRRLLGLPYWSFSSWAKVRVKRAVNFIGAFQDVLAEEARRNGASGVICGHIHHPTIELINGIEYVNTGDWVENCTAIGENHDGSLELISWAHLVAEQAGFRSSWRTKETAAKGAAVEAA